MFRPATLPPTPAPDEILNRIRNLISGTTSIHDQHTISQVLQRRFATPCGPAGEWFLARLGFRWGDTKLGAPSRFGKIRDFVRYESSSMEAVWATTEARLHDTLTAVVNGTAIGNAHHEQILRAAVIMHYIRCPRRLAQHDTNFATNLQNFRTYMLKYRRPVLEAAFYGRYRLIPYGIGALEVILDDLTQEPRDYAASGALFRVLLEDHFDRFTAFMSHRVVQVCTPATGDFLLGDHPAQAIRWNGAVAAPIGEVGLGNADEVVLPVTPKHLVVLRTAPGNTIIDPAAFDEYNQVQVRAAERFVHFQPGSSVEAFARKIRPSPEP